MRQDITEFENKKAFEFYEKEPLQKIINNNQNKLQTQIGNMAVKEIVAVQKLYLNVIRNFV